MLRLCNAVDPCDVVPECCARFRRVDGASARRPAIPAICGFATDRSVGGRPIGAFAVEVIVDGTISTQYMSTVNDPANEYTFG